MAEGDAPLRWNDTTALTWKVEIPGRGHSTPVIAGDRLFLTTAVPTGRGRRRPAASAVAGGGADAGSRTSLRGDGHRSRNGRTLWQRTATVATPHEGYHRTYGSFASNSPVTDGTRVYRLLRLARVSTRTTSNGTLLWQKDFGVKMRMDNGVWRRHARRRCTTTG